MTISKAQDPGSEPPEKVDREDIPYKMTRSVCPEHQQHSCLGIIEITDACNLKCPVCFADAHEGKTRHLTVAQISAMMDRFIRCEGAPEVVQISGGEPTLHPDLLEILQLAKDKGLQKTLLNTNGLKLVSDPELLDGIARIDPTIYLQFDGFEPQTYEKLRGRDLSDKKMKAVEALSERGMRIVLVTTVVRGVNEHEVGKIVDFALDSPRIRCVTFQPATWAGRFGVGGTDIVTDPTDRVTIREIQRLISEQSKWGLVQDDFFPVPCPDPACSAATYIHKKGDVVRPIPRLVNIEDYLDYVKNVSSAKLTDKIQESLEGLFSMSAVPGEDTTKAFCQSCGISVDWGEIEEEITMIGMMHFMDAHNFDLHRVQKCCVHEILPDDGGIVPFCVYNVLKREASDAE